MGTVPGRAVVRLTAPELELVDSAAFTVTPGAAVRVERAVADTLLEIGGTATLNGRVLDRHDNIRGESPVITAGAGSAFTVDGVTGVVTAREMGTQWLFLRHASLVDSTSVRVIPPGRLAVWSSRSRVIRLVNLNGTASQTVLSGATSSLGTFPRFDATRRRLTLHAFLPRPNDPPNPDGPPTGAIIIDTTGAPRRNIAVIGLDLVTATRQLSDGTVLLVGRIKPDAVSEFSLWRVTADDAVTLVARLPGLTSDNGAADISHDGTRVAYTTLTQLRVVTVSNGAITVLDNVRGAQMPRWSAAGDRIAYLIPNSQVRTIYSGAPVVINADGTGRRAVGNALLANGISWSPDGVYLIGANGDCCVSNTMRLLRVSDGAVVVLRFRNAEGTLEEYFQPDWR
jgi:hypothetical protein